MKKLISLILAILMAMGCISCIAEKAAASEDTAFLQIREGVTARVYGKPGDQQAVDSLQSGQFCGLIEETAEGGISWYYVFYLNSRKEGTTGYINADDAKRLKEEELLALMEDPDKINEILDLLDALNEFLKTKDTATDVGTVSTKQDGTAKKSGIADLYDRAMKALKQVLDMDVSSELGKLTEAGKELAEKAIGAGKDLLEAAADGTKNLIDKAGSAIKDELDEKLPEAKEKLGELAEGVTDAVESLKETSPGEILEKLQDKVEDATELLQDNFNRDKLDDLLDKVSDGFESLKENAGDKLKDAQEKMQGLLDSANQVMGEGTGNAIDGLNNLVTKTKDWLNSDNVVLAQVAAEAVADIFQDEGFTSGAEAVKTLVTLLNSMGGNE